jgi:hypothetical protein
LKFGLLNFFLILGNDVLASLKMNNNTLGEAYAWLGGICLVLLLAGYLAISNS